MTTTLDVLWRDGRVIGRLVNRGSFFFAYTQEWLDAGHDLSPVALPFRPDVFNSAKCPQGLPGLIADCLPDSWGLAVATNEFNRRGWGTPRPMELLAWRGSRGVGALGFRPAIESGEGKLVRVSAAALSRGAAAVARGAASDVIQLLEKGGPAGGAMPKALVLAYPDGSLAVGAPDGEGVPALLKFDHTPTAAGACEHVYARMMREAGIRAVATSLVLGENGTRHFMAERFDVAADRRTRTHFISASGLMHLEPNAMGYEHLFRALGRLGAPAADRLEMARRMIFNVLACNTDDHGKNHAFAYEEERRVWTLTPAFDVTFHGGMVDRCMKIGGEVWPSLATMEALAVDAGVARSDFASAADAVQRAIGLWPQLAEEAGVPGYRVTEISEAHKRVAASVCRGKEAVVPAAPLPTARATGTRRRR